MSISDEGLSNISIICETNSLLNKGWGPVYSLEDSTQGEDTKHGKSFMYPVDFDNLICKKNSLKYQQ